jgi:hypothetical protein
MNAKAIRCPKNRQHDKYGTCGHLLCILFEDSIYVRCPVCKVFWKLVILDSSVIEMQELPKNQRIKLESTLRVINE